ncbi:MAG TPA: condensation domain-containing protein [Pyrinomonadaceae bacterium]|nr:condensation domain-containing protein [Pyrinomonadaceae bacterium]
MSRLTEAVANLTLEQRALLEKRLKRRRAGAARPGIPRQGREQNAFPLSFAQQRLWFLHRLAPESDAYNIPNAVRASGPFNLPALEQTVNEIRRRHEVLRTTFPAREGNPVQVIAPAEMTSLPLTDLSGLPAPERETLARALVEAESCRPFGLTVEPALRVNLLRLDAHAHIILFTMHHIVSDSWSVSVLVREMAALYDAFSDGRPSPLAELPIQYADFAVWQRQWLQGEELEKQQSYWKRQLSGAPPRLKLLTDRPRPARQTFRGALHSLALSKELSADLQTLSRKQGVTLFMTLLAGFNLLLHYLTKQDDIVVGTDVANRSPVETEGLIGFFVNQLVLRTDVSGNPTFQEVLARVREVTLGAYANQVLPFERLVEILNPDRSLGHSPLFQVKLILNSAPTGVLDFPHLKLGSLNGERTTAQLDITLPLWETPEGIGGWVNYNTDLFDATAIARLSALFAKLLGAMVELPRARVSELKEILAAEDRRRQAENEEGFARSSQQKLSRARRKAVSATTTKGAA